VTSIDYSYSIPLEINLSSDDAEITKIVNRVFDEIEPDLGKSITRYRDTYLIHINTVISNLLLASNSSKDLFVSYSRNERYYRKIPQRYKARNITQTIIKIVDTLIKHSFIADHKKGFLDRELGHGRQSRMRASPKLLGMLPAGYDPSACFHISREPIVLRGPKNPPHKKGPLLDYDDNDLTIQYRQSLNTINSLLSSTEIRIELSSTEEAELLSELKFKEKLDSYISRSKLLYRVFNNGRFDHGGRFYGHWVQGLPTRFRKKLIMNGESVTELDYSGMHINMLYDQRGLECPRGDVYAVPGYDSPEARPYVKMLLQALLNAPTESSAIKAVNKDTTAEARYKGTTPKYKYADFAAMANGLKDKHTGISDKLGSGSGVELQFEDSCLAESILLQMASMKIPVVPIHDSFVVNTCWGDRVKVAMESVYEKRFGRKPKVDVKY